MVFVSDTEGYIIGYQVGLQSLVDILILTMYRLKGSKVSGKGPAPDLLTILYSNSLPGRRTEVPVCESPAGTVTRGGGARS